MDFYDNFNKRKMQRKERETRFEFRFFFANFGMKIG